MAVAGIIGIDLGKRSFQRRGAAADGAVAFRQKLPRETGLAVLARQPGAVVAMEARGGARRWGRGAAKPGHKARLIPPIHVKPWVERRKNDAADAEAIAEAASRPTMRVGAGKTEDRQAQAMACRARDLLARRRARTINALAAIWPSTA